MLGLRHCAAAVGFLILCVPGAAALPPEGQTTARPEAVVQQDDSLIAGLVILAVLLLALIAGILLIFFCCCRRGRNTRLHTRRQMAKYRQDNPSEEERGYGNAGYDTSPHNGPGPHNHDPAPKPFNIFVTSETRSGRPVSASRMLTAQAVYEFGSAVDDPCNQMISGDHLPHLPRLDGRERAVDVPRADLTELDRRYQDVPRADLTELDRRYQDVLAAHDGPLQDDMAPYNHTARKSDVHGDPVSEITVSSKEITTDKVTKGRTEKGKTIPRRRLPPLKTTKTPPAEKADSVCAAPAIMSTVCSSSPRLASGPDESFEELSEDESEEYSLQTSVHITPLDFSRLSEEFVAPPGDQPLIATARAEEALQTEMEGSLGAGGAEPHWGRRVGAEGDGQRRKLSRAQQEPPGAATRCHADPRARTDPDQYDGLRTDPDQYDGLRMDPDQYDGARTAGRTERRHLEGKKRNKKRNTKEVLGNASSHPEDTGDGAPMKTASIIDTYMADFIDAKKKNMDKKYSKRETRTIPTAVAHTDCMQNQGNNWQPDNKSRTSSRESSPENSLDRTEIEI